MSFDVARFQQILEAARNRSIGDGVDTMVVSAHLAQMRLFMVRQGIEFYARQDTFNQRREFIRQVCDFNQLSSRFDAIIDNFLIDGKGLLYFRPSKGGLYRIHYFTRDQYRTFYDEDGNLEEVQVIYSFKVKPPRGFAAQLGTDAMAYQPTTRGDSLTNAELRWIHIRVLADRIEQTVSNEKPQFDNLNFGGKKETLVNTLGFIPSVELFNNRGLEAGSGFGEFDQVASYILQHDRMIKSIKGNLKFFGTPTLVSSRPRHDLMEPEDDGNKFRATISSNSGFSGLNRPSTRVSEPIGNGSGEGLRVPRVIANVEAADRVGYITPDAVSSDLVNFANVYQEMIRSALGGVDDLSISSGATAYEVRTLYGRVATSSQRKNRDLFEYGFCKCFSMMIQHEEYIFRESLAQALGLVKPAPILEEFEDEEQQAKAEAKYDKLKTAWDDAVSEAIIQIKETGEMPPGVVGLIPDGDTKCLWRFMGQVFEDSPQDILNNSMVCRNLQELGVSSIEALQYLFPDKTPEERASMLSGYPFRMVEATQRSAGIFIDMARSMFQVPHPAEPDLPLAADPQLDLVPALYRTLDHLRRELSYSGNYENVDFASIPPTLSDADRARAAAGERTDMERDRSDRRTAAAQRLNATWGADGAPAAGGDAYTAQLPVSGNGQLGAGVQQRRADSDSSLYGLGGDLSYDPLRPESGASGQLGNTNPLGELGRFGNPDLSAPTNLGVPLAGGAESGSPAGRRGGPQSATGRSSAGTSSRRRS